MYVTIDGSPVTKKMLYDDTSTVNVEQGFRLVNSVDVDETFLMAGLLGLLASLTATRYCKTLSTGFH